MPKQGKGEKSWQRVIDLVEALLDYESEGGNHITHLHAEWEETIDPATKVKTIELHVTGKMQGLHHLLKAKNSFKPNQTTSDTQVKKYIGEALTKYLTKELKIMRDNRPESERQGNPNWNFNLKLWKKKDKTTNLEELAKACGGEPSINIQINSRQNSDGKTEIDIVADCPPDKSIRVAVSQMPKSVPVWKGRDELVAKLTAKLVQILPDGTSPPKVLAIVGQGGMGKTSLAIKLVEGLGMNWQNSVSQAGKSFLAGGYECVMYFEVYKGISFDEVAGFVLSEGLGIPGAAELKKPEEKIAKIMMGLQQTRCLLILDNLEPILRPAVEGENPDSFDSSLIHRTISPDWGKLLNALVYQQHQSQMILTSREVPGDLADTRYPGLALDAELVHIEVLQGVDEKATVEILQRQLTDNLADLQWISRRVEGHLFLLTQLVALGKGRPGYLRKHPELVTKNVELMLQEQMVRQSAAGRDLVSRMCVLRVPIDVRGLTFLRLYADDDLRFEYAAAMEESAELTDAEIEETAAILERLVGANLVQSRYDQDKCEDFYDLHRVIEEFLQGEYRQELPKLLESVYKFYCTGKAVDNPQSLADLQAVLEAQHFAFRLGNYPEAYYLIPDTYLTRWGYWNLSKELYEQILPYVEGDRRYYCLRSLGVIHRDFGNWDLAEKYFKDALAIAETEDNKSDIATSLGMLGNIERNRGNWDEAEKLYRQSLALRTELGARKGIATSWELLGDIEQNRGNWDEAEKLYRQALALRTELGDREGMASSWASLGEIERNRGNWDEAEKLYRQSLEVETELGDRKGIATSWELLGYLEQCRGNLDEAEKLCLQSLALRTELGDRSGMASCWGSLGNIEENRGSWDEAEKLYRQSLKVETELGALWRMASCWGVLGEIERKRGNLDEAEKLYRQCLEVETELGDRQGMASCWGVLGEIERNRGNWDEAEKLFRQSLEMMTELGDRAGIASCWASLGDIERNRGKWDEAERLYQQCVEIETELGDREGMASSWASLGYIEQNRGNWDEAEKLYRQHLEMMTELGDRSGIASSWGLLGDIERNRSNWDEAEKLYRQALALRTELGDREGMAKSIGCLGDNELGRGNLDTAEQLLTEALGKMQKLGMTWHIAETNYDLARLERKRGNTEVAQQHYDTSHQIFQQLGAAKDVEKIEKEWHSID